VADWSQQQVASTSTETSEALLFVLISQRRIENRTGRIEPCAVSKKKVKAIFLVNETQGQSKSGSEYK
jgi:uncharacterized protein YaiL (DUF2058 family)